MCIISAKGVKRKMKDTIRSQHLGVRISPEDMQLLNDMIAIMRERTNLRITKGDMISHLIQIASKRGFYRRTDDGRVEVAGLDY